MDKGIRKAILGSIAVPLAFFNVGCKQEIKQRGEQTTKQTRSYYNERYRPQFHFSPEEMWMNDPNGLLYNDGTYHLFYQYYPDSTVWGPMHWGHATSPDLVRWEHRPVALFPDEHGYIFSGSAVIDTKNTSGLGTRENPPMVAIFTYHSIEGEQGGRSDYQTQGIAFSLDNGNSWTKFKDNPVVKNQGNRDFRDPKVFWNDIAGNWTMLLVAGDHLQIWNSVNLKQWTQVSEFGKDKGAHGGVWECPDLFPLKIEGTDEIKWVLLISINPGAPNGGSGTQYFIGDFDGTTFTTQQTQDKWIDLGRDNYAGVTYNNTPNNERVFIGWMSNWDYARDTPTEKWRSAMTVPRKLSLKKVNGVVELYNYPVAQLREIIDEPNPAGEFTLKGRQKQRIALAHGNQSEITFTIKNPNATIYFDNIAGDSLAIHMDSATKRVTFDRGTSGRTNFNTNFVNGIQQMPIPNLPDTPIEIRILLDRSSLELFINKGQYVMTNQLFPREAYSTLTIKNISGEPLEIADFTERRVESIW